MESNQLGKKYVKSHKKKHYDLGGNQKEIYNLLKVNPTIKSVIEQTKRDKRQVAKDINRIIVKGLIKRVARGIYQVIKTTELITQSLQKIYNDRCYFCDFSDVIEIHHIIERVNGGLEYDNNEIGLCPNCHSKLHKFNIN